VVVGNKWVKTDIVTPIPFCPRYLSKKTPKIKIEFNDRYEQAKIFHRLGYLAP
jgi:hypothetical protein